MTRSPPLYVLRTAHRRRRSVMCWRKEGVSRLGAIVVVVVVVLMLSCTCTPVPTVSAHESGTHVRSQKKSRALSSSAKALQATSSSFELLLSPASSSSGSSGSSTVGANGNSNSNQKRNRNGRRKGGYSMKKETSELLQSAIASTVMTSGRCDIESESAGSSASSSFNYNGTSARLGSCPYQSMTVKMERAEWTQPDDPLTLRFYVVATIRTDSDYEVKRSQSSSFDLRQELDAFVLDFFYGDLFLSTVLASWPDDQDQDEDEVLTRAMMASVELQVSESQGRIYQTPTPSASVVILALAFVGTLFAVDGVVRYVTPVHLCASRRTGATSEWDDGSVERQTLNSDNSREIT